MSLEITCGLRAVEAIIPKTFGDMRSFGLKRIVPAHCTGWRAVGALVQEFGEEVIVPSAVGPRKSAWARCALPTLRVKKKGPAPDQPHLFF